MTEHTKQLDTVKSDDSIHLPLDRQAQEVIVPDVTLSLTHDKFFKLVFSRSQLVVSFLKQVLSKRLQKQLILEELKVKLTSRLDNKFKEFLADMVYEVPLKKGGTTFIHIIIEHKSQNDYGTIFQLANYVSLLHAEEAKTFKKWKRGSRLSPVIPIILHHGKSVFKGETQRANVIRKLPGADRYQLRMEAILFDLSAIAQNKVPTDPNCPELWPVLAAMKNIFRKNVGILTFKKIMEILQVHTADDPYYIELARNFVHYFGTNFEPLTEDEIQDMDATIEKTITGNKIPTFQNSYYRAGEAQGEARGEARKQVQIALNLLNDGLSVESISRNTGLSYNEVEALQKQ